MVIAQDPLPGGEDLLVQGDSPVQVPRLPVGVGEVVAGGQRPGVVVAQDPLAVGEDLLVQRDGAAQVPRGLVAPARLFREARVSGWSSPRTRCRSARACSYSGMARPRSPAAW